MIGIGQTYPEFAQLIRTGVQILASKLWKRAIETLSMQRVETESLPTIFMAIQLRVYCPEGVILLEINFLPSSNTDQ